MYTKTFCRCGNNTVVALMMEQDYELMMAGGEGYKMFLFSNAAKGAWICGDLDLMGQLTQGARIIDQDFGVPFSNGWQLYNDRQTLVDVLSIIGNLSEAIEAFGLVPAPVAAVA